MGLDIYIEPGLDSFRAGSYSGFHEWRCWLASIAGYDLERMYLGSYVWTGKEPFYDLLNHSDCDGDLGKRACKKLSKDFQKYFFIVLLSNQPKGESDVENFVWLIQRYLRWKGAVDMVADGVAKKLEFC